MRILSSAIIGLALLLVPGARPEFPVKALHSTLPDPAPQPCPSGSLLQICNWGVGLNAPTVWPNSTQVMMTPVVMDLFTPPANKSQAAFVSFTTGADVNSDTNGVLRVIDGACNEISRFPASNATVVIPPSCPAALNLNNVPHLSPASGLAVGDVDGVPGVEIIGVLDDHTTNQGRIIAFHLDPSGNVLRPLWCSTPLPVVNDHIPKSSAPAIAQLDQPGSSFAAQSEIIIDNKVYEATGALRFSGYSSAPGNCAPPVWGGMPCPRSSTVVVASLFGAAALPHIIAGRGVYRSSSTPLWTGQFFWKTTSVTHAQPSDVFPAVAEIVNTSLGPEIVVTDHWATKVLVLSRTGTLLASATLPNPGFSHCGGPPTVGDIHPAPGPEIGVASCSRYTLLKYNGTPTLATIWSSTIDDPSGATSSALFNTNAGARIYYADRSNLMVFDGLTGCTINTVPNTNGTLINGPTIASFGPGQVAQARVLVSANNYGLTGGEKGVRIFDTNFVGRSFWNQHTYHVTNVTSSVGTIPVSEAPSWLPPARNTYRAQQ